MAMGFTRSGKHFVFFGRKGVKLQPKGAVVAWGGSKPLFELDAPGCASCTAVGFIDKNRKIIGVFIAAQKSGPAETTLHTWDVNSHALTQSMNVPYHVSAFAVSPDSKWFALAGQNKSITVYFANSLQPAVQFRAHDAPVTALVFHPTLPMIASASADLTIKLWNSITGEPLHTLLGPSSKPISLAFNASGSRLACSSQDNRTRVWNLSKWDQPVPE